MSQDPSGSLKKQIIDLVAAFDSLPAEAKARLLNHNGAVTEDVIKSEASTSSTETMAAIEAIERDHYRKTLDFKLQVRKVLVWLSTGLVTIFSLAILFQAWKTETLDDLFKSVLETFKIFI